MIYARLAEAARISGIPPRTLREMVADGRVRSVRKSERVTLVDLQDACDQATGVARLRNLTIRR